MNPPTGRRHWLIQRLVLEAGFRFVLPVLARLPATLGLAGARLWGRLLAQIDCEWRSVALREHFVARKTRLALREMDPALTDHEVKRRVVGRFACASQEELEGHWLALGLKADVPVRIDGLPALRPAIEAGRGLVLLTFHFDASIWGIGCLGRAGLRLSPMSSAIVEDARVLPAVRTYFQRKYAGLSRLLNGGQVMPSETSLKALYRRLLRGEGVVVLADAHTRDVDGALTKDFFGQERLFAPGALRLVRKSGAATAAFVCLRESTGYRIVISPPLGLDGDAESACRAALSFLETHVRGQPERWWAADLLPDFVIIAPPPLTPVPLCKLTDHVGCPQSPPNSGT